MSGKDDKDVPTRPETPISRQFAPVDCPLCFHQNIWHGANICPGCNRTPEEILESGQPGQISRFKVPGLYAMFPELARIDTLRDMPAVSMPPKDPSK